MQRRLIVQDDVGSNPNIATDRSVTELPLVVLLQGPVGSFFKHFMRTLRKFGFRVLKINFSIGDVLQTHGTGTVLFQATPELWRKWFYAFLKGQRPKCVVLFGDQRLYHRFAIEACNELGVDVWCVEEGYLRPDYVTFELGGNNATSALARHELHAQLNAAPATPPPLPLPIKGNSFLAMARAGIPYYVVNSLGYFFTQNYLRHRSRSLLPEAFFWSRNFYRKWRHKRRNAHSVIDLLECHYEKYFVVALQVYDDLNIVHHGKGWSNGMLIEEATRSFAKHARPEDILVIKCHPLDRGHWNYDAIVAEMAAIAGISERVRLIDDAPLGLLLRHARGMVNINSTSGILGICVGCPVFVLGDAIYKHAGLTQFGELADLARFWREPMAPNKEYAEKFLNLIVRDTQINGSLYIKEYFDRTIAEMIKKIMQRREDEGEAVPFSRPGAGL